MAFGDRFRSGPRTSSRGFAARVSAAAVARFDTVRADPSGAHRTGEARSMIRNTAPDTTGPDAKVAAPPSERPLRLGMVAWMVAGIRTHYENVARVAGTAPDVALTQL